MDQIQKQFNALYIYYLQKGDTLDSNSVVKLRTLAQLCPYKDGTAVWQARSLLKVFDKTEYVNTCELFAAPVFNTSSGAKEAHSPEIVQAESGNQIKLYPNPNNGNFIVEIANVKGNAEVEVLNTLGSVIGVYNAILNESNHSIGINTIGLRGGMYFVKIKVNNTLLETKRVVINE